MITVNLKRAARLLRARAGLEVPAVAEVHERVTIRPLSLARARRDN